jgi:hypothetical protein
MNLSVKPRSAWSVHSYHTKVRGASLPRHTRRPDSARRKERSLNIDGQRKRASISSTTSIIIGLVPYLALDAGRASAQKKKMQIVLACLVPGARLVYRRVPHLSMTLLEHDLLYIDNRPERD